MVNLPRKILLLVPRLDVSFKQGDVPVERGPIIPIRKHWEEIEDTIAEFCFENKIELDVIEKPLWQFNPVDYENSDADYIIVPHKEPHNFSVKGKQCLYLMQTWHPQYFSLSAHGWGSNLPFLNLMNMKEKVDEIKMKQIWSKMKSRIETNTSKFDQPNIEMNTKDYVLFICQLPHDEVIRYHSNISVADALLETIDECKKMNVPLVVKGHPINPGAMSELRNICQSTHVKWVENVSIHSAIKNSIGCVTVNSGTGFEVMLHGKPLFAFGDAEYSYVLPNKNISDFIKKVKENDIVDIDIYKKFIFHYFDNIIDSTDWKSLENIFNKLI